MQRFFFVLGVNIFYLKRYRFLAYLFFVLSVLTHIQFLILVGVFSSIKLFKIIQGVLKRLSVSVSDLWLVCLPALFGLMISIFFWSHITYKISAYYEVFGVFEYLRMMVFFVFSLAYYKKKSEVIVAFFFLFLVISIVGGMRVNVFGYFLFLYFALPYRRGVNFGVILFFVYFLVGWVEYSYDVFKCGVNRPC